MEAAKVFHYRWDQWLAESPILRGRMMAHELHKGMRDTYNLEQRQAALESGADPAKPRSPAPWDAIREKFFR